MVAGIFDLCGAFGGKLSGPNKNNQKGMFENSVIRNEIVKPFFAAIGADRLGQRPLPDRGICRDKAVKYGFANEWQERVEKVMRNDGYGGGHWFYKGAKMCLMWPIWHAAFPRAKWVIVRRNDEGILQSCLRTPFMRAYRNSEGWNVWLDAHKECFGEMLDAGLQIRTVWSDNVVAGDFVQIKDAIAWAGLRWDQAAVDEFVDPALYGQGKAKKK